MLAYVGPGAGMVLAGSFLTLLLALFTALLLFVSWPLRAGVRWFRARHARRQAAVRRVIILGLDGLDPRITELLLAQGELPHLAQLQQQGTYSRLQTTWPPLSPVAWSSFSTGVNPGKHAIFDFVNCNPQDYRPQISTVVLRPDHRVWRCGPLVCPLGKPELRLLRRSKAFWRVLGEQGIFSAVLRVPVSFPPEPNYGVQLAAASVPDLRGTQGTYTHFVEWNAALDSATETDSQTLSENDEGRGRSVLIHRRSQSVHALLPGPVHPWQAGSPELLLPLWLERRPAGQITLHISGQSIPLQIGQFSPWVRITFRLAWRREVAGICRFLLKSWDAPFSLYCSPLNLDPAKPAMPLSSPPKFAKYLAAKQGPFATLGLAEDTAALNDGVLTPQEFLALAYDVHAEREQMFADAIQRVRRGLVACVFDAPDRIQHMFWSDELAHAAQACSTRDKQTQGIAGKAGNGSESREESNSSAATICDLYRRLDGLVGRTMQACDRETALVVLSDHGFQSFCWGVDLNAWLAEHGYLVWKRPPTPDSPTTLEDIDWSRTRAFAFGLSGLQINLQARQREGILVPGSEYDDLVAELRGELSGLLHPELQQIAILEAAPRETVFTGPYLAQAPDLVIGYNAGYRVHWQTALGGSVGQVFTHNTKHWQGDHCQHPDVVPGVLFSNQTLQPQPARMIDLAPTVLDWLGVPIPAYIDGKSLRCDDANSSR